MTETKTDLTPAPNQRTCPNCQTPLNGQYCAHCGQNQKGVDRYFTSLVADAFEDVFQPNSRTFRTISALLFRPGFLSAEYFAGRRARYIQPLRLYFITSLAFFFLISLQNFFSPADLDITDADLSEEEIVTLGEMDPLVPPDDDTHPATSKLELPWLTPSEEVAFNAKLEAQFEKASALVKENPGRLLDIVLDLAPPVIFLLLPVFALLLKLFYVTSGMFYTQHLILAVHNHCFLFIALLLDNLLETLPAVVVDWTAPLTDLWIVVYMFLSLKWTYRQSWPVTLLKGVLLFNCYLVIFSIAALAAMLIGLMSL